jgi:hypothetical protein
VSQHFLALPSQCFRLGFQFGGSPCEVRPQFDAHFKLWCTTSGTRKVLANRLGAEAGGEQALYLTDNEGSIIGIFAVSIAGPLRDEHALLLVVAKRTPADSRTLGQLPNQQTCDPSDDDV